MAVHRSARGGGHRRFESHRLGGPSQKIAERIGWNQPAASDKNRPKLAFADQDVKRTARQACDFGGIIDPICKDTIGRKRQEPLFIRRALRVASGCPGAGIRLGAHHATHGSGED